jgi:hypothetical protein
MCWGWRCGRCFGRLVLLLVRIWFGRLGGEVVGEGRLWGCGIMGCEGVRGVCRGGEVEGGLGNVLMLKK